jgi:hypothetical protein
MYSITAVSFVYFPEDLAMSDKTETAENTIFNNNPDNVYTAGTNLDQETTDQENNFDTETWYSSESSRSEIEFNKLVPTPFETIEKYNIPSVAKQYLVLFGSYNWENLYLDDSNYFETRLYWNDQRGYDTYIQTHFKIYCGGAGVLVTESRTVALSLTPIYTYYTDVVDTSLDIVSSNLDNEGYLSLMYEAFFEVSTSVTHRVFLITSNDGYIQIGTTKTYAHSQSTFVGLKIQIDNLYFLRNTIINNIRSEYQYASPTRLTHKKIVPSVPHAKEIVVNLKEDETVTNVNPSANWSVSSNTLTISSPTELSYEILSSSNCSYHLTIQDKTATYLQDIGFENAQYLNDWTTNGTATVTTSQWFDGYYSLETYNSAEFLYREFFATDGDEADFEEDVDEFDIKLNGLQTLDTITHAGEDKLRLYELASPAYNLGARRDNLAIDTNIYTTFGSEIYLAGGRCDRIKITLHFSDASTQDHIELIATTETVAFNFTITSDKTISDIDIYYGNEDFYVLIGGLIYVSYIKLFDEYYNPYEISLSSSLPLDDYYFGFAIRCEGTTTVNIAEIDRDIEITLLDTWEQVFYYAHTDSVTLSITPYMNTSIFFDNFKIAQTSTEIKTDEPSKSLISSTLRSWDGRKNPLMPFEEVELQFIDRTDLKIEYLYYTTTNAYGVATWTLNSGLEQKEYNIKTQTSEQIAGLYFFDETVTDWGTNEIDGTLQGGASYSDEDSHGCIYFDGSGDYVNIAEEVFPDGSETVSISIWFKTDNTDVRRRTIFETSLNYAFWFEIEDDHTLKGGALTDVASYTLDKSFTVNDGEWHHAVWTYTEGEELKLYFDGEYIDEVAVSGNIQNTNGLHIGTYRSANDRWFEGFIDEPRIYHKILSESEIYEHYQHQVECYFTPSNPSEIDYAETDLLDAWDFSEGDTEGFSIYDNPYYRAIDSGMDICIQDETFGYMKQRKALDLNSEYYNQFKMRIFSNRTNPHISILSYSNLETYYADNFLSNTWTIITIDLSDHDGWTDTAGLMFRYATANAWEMYNIDYIKLVHTDSWLPQTNEFFTDELYNAFDLEENKIEPYIDIFHHCAGYENGYAYGQVSSDGYFLMPKLDANYDISAYEYIEILIYCSIGASTDTSFFIGDTALTDRGRVYLDLVDGWNHLFISIQELADSDWFGDWEADDFGYFYFYDFNTNTGGVTRLEYFRVIDVQELTYTTIQNSVLLESETNDLLYDLYLDFNFIGTFSDLSLIPLPSSVGTHFVQVQPYRTDDSYITQNVYTYYYYVSEIGIMKIIIHDQSGNVLNFDQFKVFFEGYRLYDNYLYFTDTSTSFNLTITDLFDNQLYSNSSEVFEEFKQIQLTLFSVKIQNVQENPIYFRIERGSKYYSEWIFTYEVVEYFLEEATYTIWIYYSDVDGEFGVSENGTVVNYNYYIDDDTAIRVTGYSIEDVWGNVVNLIDNLDAVNASLTNQIIEVDIHIENINTSITNQVVDVEIYLTNVNTTLGSQILSIQTDLINLNTTLFTQTVDILTNIANVNTTLFDQTVLLLTDIANVNTTLYTQTLTILSDLTNINSTIFSQTVSILTLIENVNTTLFEQTLTVIAGISNMNSTLFAQTIEILTVIENINSTLFIQTVEILNQISNVNTTLYAQTVSILTEISNINATLFDQTVLLLTDLANVNTTLYSQTLTILSDITNINSTIFSQTVSILTLIENVNSTLFEQTLTVIAGISNMNSTIFAQTIQILTVIENINSTLFIQTVEILNQISNVNTTLYAQTVSILTEISNINATLFDQTVLLLTDIANVNTTLYSQTLTILSDITNINSTIFSQTVSILTLIENVNSTLFEQTLTVIAGISNMNSTIFAQTVQILTVIENINSTLFIQTVEILNQISNVNTTLFVQTIAILTELDLHNDTVVMYVLQNSQLLAELQIYNTMYHTTHFTLTTLTGVGLDFITAAVYINGTRIYDSQQIYYNNTYLEIEVRDYFGNLLYSYSCRITSDIDLNLPINLILQTFENPYDVAIEISLSNIHNDTTIISWIIPPHSTISVYILASSYDITITPLADSFTNTTHTIYYEPQTIKFQDLGSKQTYSVECVTSAKPLPSFVSSEEQIKQAKTLLLLSLLINAFMIALTSMLIKWGAIKVINFILLPFMHTSQFIFGSTPKVLVRDAGGLRFVNLDQYEELKKRTEKGMI